uniref:Uncharacterized protein n=1 Tax=Chenopodium quinoa TaxID=63459 RepID=A0A803MQL9_CHEQI
MDQGVWVKASLLVFLLVAFTSSEARQKHRHQINKGHHRVSYSPLPPPPSPLAPTPTPAPDGGTPPSSSTPPQSPTNPDPPLSDAPSPPPPEDEEIMTTPPPFDPYNLGTPSVFLPPGYGPPYQTHGCHYPCADSNDCDWPSLSPFTAEVRHKHIDHRRNCHLPVKPSPKTPPPAPALEPTDGIPPYQIHGCGYLCSDSNDCDWPCTVCCRNQTFCYDEPFIVSDPFPTLPPSPILEEPIPTPALAPIDGVDIPPYQIHSCGYLCTDSNDCVGLAPPVVQTKHVVTMSPLYQHYHHLLPLH